MNDFVLIHRGEGRVPLGWALAVALIAPGLFALLLPSEPTEVFGYMLSRSIGVGLALIVLGAGLLGLLIWGLTGTAGRARTEVSRSGLRVFPAGDGAPLVLDAASVIGFRTERRRETFRVLSRGSYATVSRDVHVVLAQPSNRVVYLDLNGWFAARAEARLRAFYER